MNEKSDQLQVATEILASARILTDYPISFHFKQHGHAETSWKTSASGIAIQSMNPSLKGRLELQISFKSTPNVGKVSSGRW